MTVWRPAAAAADSAVAKFGFSENEVGFLLVDPATGQVLAAQNADTPFIPASVAKLATVYAAWRILGPDFRFHTRLFRTGSTLYLQGGGDPVLTAPELAALVAQLRAQGGAGPWGEFVYDAGWARQHPEVDAGQPMAAVYNAGFGALNVDFNRLQISWSRDDSGVLIFRARAVADGLNVPADWVSFAPATDDLPPGANFVYAGDETREGWAYPRGLPESLGDGGAIFLPVKDTVLNTVEVFRRIAANGKVAVPPGVAGTVPPTATRIADNASRPLSDITTGLLKFSNNMTAELIGLAVSRQLTGRALSSAESSRIVIEWLKARLPGADWTGFSLVNHSGLSTDNRISPRQMAALLTAIAGDPILEKAFPRSGMGGAGAATVAKTGTMDFAGGLGGYFTARGGRRLAFAVFALDADKRAALDRGQDRRILAPTPGARSWTGRKRALEDALIGSWRTAF